MRKVIQPEITRRTNTRDALQKCVARELASNMLHVEIRVHGLLDAHWSAWFEELTITQTDQGETVLSGDVIDQATLYGLLAKLRDLGLTLQSVNSVQKETQSEKGCRPEKP